MKKLSIILACVLATMMSCTKSKEVHPEIGDGNDEIVTVGMKDVHVKYTRTDHTELSRVVFHYSLAELQQFEAAEMTKQETFFELTLHDLLSDTLYGYYYELFYNGGDASNTPQKTFHTQAFDQPQPPTPPVAELPTVVTTEVSEITTNSAICGGEVTNDGGAEVTERGICWGTNENPTLDDNHVAADSGTGAFTVNIMGLTAHATYYVRAYATNNVGTEYGNEVSFTTQQEDPTGDWVDLGLPSGLLWATRNVGASNTEDYGSYFAWAETQPKSVYKWRTYIYCCNNSYSSTLTKYCNDSIYGCNGYTDNLTILQPDDDAATANWGDGARMPTKEEWQELYNNCTSVWTTQNGVNGRRFTGPNGNILFLPATGYRYDNELIGDGSYVSYWSSSLCTDGPLAAWYFIGHLSGGCYMGYSFLRDFGRSVRPVFPPSKK